MNSSWMGGAVRWSILAAVAALASACGSSDDAGTDNAIWPSSATSMVVKNSGGGFVGPAPQGSACQTGEASYTLTVATRSLAWSECQSASTPYTFAGGSRTLEQGELDSLTAALKAVALSKQDSCGADKSTLSLEVTTASAKHDYLDDFYSCNHAGVYVTGIDDVLQLSAMLAK